jgi:hypothetical protein
LPHNVFNQYSPSPLGNDVFAQFGDHFSLPVFGNFDPPVASSSLPSLTNSVNPLDVNNDGFVSPVDALIVINQLNTGKQPPRLSAFAMPPFFDVNGDAVVSPADALRVINDLNSHRTAAGGEGEGGAIDAALAANGYSAPDLLQDELLGLLAADTLTTKPRQVRH